MPKYLVVKTNKVDRDDTDFYQTRFILPEVIDAGDIVELTSLEVDQVQDSYSTPVLRCLEIIGPQAIKEMIQVKIKEAKARAETIRKRDEGYKAAAAKRETKRKERAIAKAKELLAKEKQIG